MLRAEDLMVGDLVKFPYGIDKVCDLPYVEGKGICASFAASATLFPVPVGMLEPIPLTPEILEKNGFSGEGYNMGVIGFHTDPIPEVKDGYEVFIWKDMCLEIKHGFTHLKRYTFYVHELQHALKLCGIEKEIEL